MNFLRKNILYILALVIIAILYLFPSVKLKLKDMLFPIAEIENAITLKDTDLDIQLKGLNTPDTNLKNLKGDKLIFLNFWGTWCPPCREEWPSIQKLYENRKGKVDFVLIAMQDEEEKVVEYLKENNFTAPVYIAESPISDKLLPSVFPTTLILSPNGQILKKETKTLDWNSKEILEFIDNVTN